MSLPAPVERDRTLAPAGIAIVAGSLTMAIALLHLVVFVGLLRGPRPRLVGGVTMIYPSTAELVLDGARLVLVVLVGAVLVFLAARAGRRGRLRTVWASAVVLVALAAYELIGFIG